MPDHLPAPTEILIYPAPGGRVRIDVRVQDGTVWLTQRLMAELFQVRVPTVNVHLKRIFRAGELAEEAVIRDFLITAADGKQYLTKHYNLDAIIHVGYRVRSAVGAQFRRWATERLREYLVKGFALDDERLSNPGGLDYFDELLERIREIRASEKRFYQKVRDLFAATSRDYDKGSEAAQAFFSTIQNKMLFAVTGSTAAELVLARADCALPNMGLTSCKGGRVRQADVTVSKNYLGQEELRQLDRLVGMFLDYAEDRAERRAATTMRDWIEATDRFLAFNERRVLEGPGRVSHDRAEQHALEQYGRFDAARRARELEAAEAEAERELEQAVKALAPAGKKPARD